MTKAAVGVTVLTTVLTMTPTIPLQLPAIARIAVVVVVVVVVGGGGGGGGGGVVRRDNTKRSSTNRSGNSAKFRRGNIVCCRAGKGLWNILQSFHRHTIIIILIITILLLFTTNIIAILLIVILFTIIFLFIIVKHRCTILKGCVLIRPIITDTAGESEVERY